ncbi:hypothetical protein HanRHA438_Chr04g0173101 [Helianthus annuus]|nr:hypothetical protein HanRHA438_Chr04g0173101 [Helianthus annuus]
MWGRSVYNMEAVDSCGRSGGLVSLWNPTVFSCSELNLVNVYAPNDAALRKTLWSDLLVLKNSRKGLWVFLGDFTRLFEDYYNSPGLNKSCTLSFIALIPKVKHPLRPSDFRPISFIGCINKFIFKVLVNRLKRMIGKHISEEQSAFIAGRNITDGPLMLNDVLAWMKHYRKVGMIFKSIFTRLMTLLVRLSLIL